MIFVSGAGGKGFINWINLLKELNLNYICADMKKTPFNNIVLPKGDSKEFIDAIKNIKSDYYIFCVDEEIINIANKNVLEDNKVLNPTGEIINFCDKYLLSTISSLTPKSSLKPLDKYPFIAKKRLSRGSKGLKLIKNKNDLNNLENGYFFQEYIEGEDISFDVLILENEYMFLYTKNLQRYNNITFNFELGFNNNYNKFVGNVLKSIKPFIKNKKYIINIDARIKNNKIYLLEVNPRPSFHFPAIIDKRIFKNFLEDKLSDLKPFKKIKYGQIIFV